MRQAPAIAFESLREYGIKKRMTLEHSVFFENELVEPYRLYSIQTENPNPAVHKQQHAHLQPSSFLLQVGFLANLAPEALSARAAAAESAQKRHLGCGVGGLGCIGCIGFRGLGFRGLGFRGLGVRV